MPMSLTIERMRSTFSLKSDESSVAVPCGRMGSTIGRFRA
jgi:hypothetical protein